MGKITTILFDFDGVIVNTEPQYDIYMDALGEKHKLGIENFALQVKGTTTPDILKKHFSHLTEEERKRIKKELEDFEQQMDFPFIDGITDFISYLKENNYKLGLVTSSADEKMERALRLLNMDNTFDTKVTSSRITEGKPNPMCYLLAAKDLDSSINECIVFEDSFHGIQAGKNAGMEVVGVSSTIPKEQLKEKANYVIPDFLDLNHLISILG